MTHPFLFLQWFAEKLNIHVGEHVVYTWLVMLILIGLAFLVSRSLSMVPSGVQNVMETIVVGIENLIEETMGEEGKPFLPLLATLAMFILLCNLMGLIPGFYPPTASLNTNIPMALIVFFMTHYIGIKKHGTGYIKHFMGPIIWLAPLMLIIEFIGHLSRPLSLTLRLFGNMAGHEIVLMVFLGLVPFLIPLPMMLLGVLVAFIQAFVFTLLTMIYISGSLEEAH
jgi:F-type H+-transporting ATPase subunit a